jgi:diguanylate cyclase (GGDEF)-like protein
VLLIDLDHFKSINDRFGHAIGDRVLQVFAETTTAAIRPTDLVGRLGGEEFAVVLHNAPREKALVMAESLRLAFSEAAHNVDGRPVAATISIGMVLSEQGPLDIATLLAQADQALYRAKERGRNRTEIASLDLVLERDVAFSARIAAVTQGRAA